MLPTSHKCYLISLTFVPLCHPLAKATQGQILYEPLSSGAVSSLLCDLPLGRAALPWGTLATLRAERSVPPDLSRCVRAKQRPERNGVQITHRAAKITGCPSPKLADLNGTATVRRAHSMAHDPSHSLNPHRMLLPSSHRCGTIFKFSKSFVPSATTQLSKAMRRM